MSGDDELQRIDLELRRTLPAAARVALLERAIDIGDARKAVELGWRYRLELMSAVYHTGDWQKLLVHFAWCLAHHDRDPARFDGEDLLWKYKWVLNEAARMQRVGRERLLGLAEDMERRFLAAGSTLRAVHEHVATMHAKLGDTDATRAAIVRWHSVERDRLSDCAACEPDTHIELLTQLGEHDAALDEAFAIFARRARCGEVPHRTYARMLAPLWRRGERDRALDAFRQGYPLVRRVDKLVEAHAQHLAFAAAAGLEHDAIAIFERHVERALVCPTDWERMLFLEATRFAMDTLAARGTGALAVRLPETVGIADRDRPRAEAIAAWARAEASALASGFDRRNGNSEVGRFLSSWAAMPTD